MIVIYFDERGMKWIGVKEDIIFDYFFCKSCWMTIEHLLLEVTIILIVSTIKLFFSF
jgi:hypothetical protein